MSEKIIILNVPASLVLNIILFLLPILYNQIMDTFHKDINSESVFLSVQFNNSTVLLTCVYCWIIAIVHQLLHLYYSEPDGELKST